MTKYNPPPTYADPVLEQGGRFAFNPIWLKWFVDLTASLNTAQSDISTVEALLPSLGKPVRVMLLAPGSGNFIPETVGNLALVEQCGGGSGGNRGTFATPVPGGGGGAGASRHWWVTLAKATYPYAVGAKGVGASTDATVGTVGGHTHFDGVVAPGGHSVGTSNLGNAGGQIGNIFGAVDAAGIITLPGILGVPGGCGGDAINSSVGRDGGPVGYSNPTTTGAPLNGYGGAVGGANGGAGAGGGGGGGSSDFGRGGAGGAGNTGGAAVKGADADGYGAGGGGGGCGSVATADGGDGSPGMIRITEWRTS